MYAVGQTEFDHAVVMVRDWLDALAPHFERQGFHLKRQGGAQPRVVRLTVREGIYVELLRAARVTGAAGG